ncbi:MAG: PDZ domain-containing protein [Gammaproteobacteria bacterium]|nr:PDZ domain-containing protein [Gammaproteobacteria bacterium]
MLHAQTPPDSAAELLSAVVGVEAEVPSSARTADSLGTHRSGSGVVIDDRGHVLTIGYLILEAARAEIVLPDARTVPAEIVAYDHASGFGLLRAIADTGVTAMRLGVSAELDEGDPVLVVSRSGATAAQPAVVVSRRTFAGYWEYLLERAIFTAPPHPRFGGAALVGTDGRLLGIGSLYVGDAGTPSVAGNMFVPIDGLKPILRELREHGRARAPPQPWLGVYTVERGGRLTVRRLAEDGPAAAAGLEPGDVIVAIGGETITSQADFYRKLWARGDAGVKVPLSVVRSERRIELIVKSANREAWLRLDPAL